MTYHFDFAALLPYGAEFAYGCWLTVVLSGVAITIGIVIGIATALAWQSRLGAVRLAATSYVEVVRNTPFLVQALFIYFGLPSLGLSLQPWGAAVLALSINCGAFAGGIIRGGIDAVPRGQTEAGAAIGLSPLQVFRHVVLRPALRIIFPALSGQFILALLTTSIVSSISAEELTSIAEAIDTLTFRSFEIYVVVAALYLSLSLLFASAFKVVNRIFFSYPIR